MNCLVTACRMRQRAKGEDADCGLKLGWHGHGPEPTGRQHRQQQPGGGLRIGVGADVARLLGASDQVSEVSRDRPDRVPSRAGQIRVRGHRRCVREQHAVGGPCVRAVRGRRPLAWSPVRGLGEDANQQPGRGVGAVGEVIQ